MIASSLVWGNAEATKIGAECLAKYYQIRREDSGISKE